MYEKKKKKTAEYRPTAAYLCSAHVRPVRLYKYTRKCPRALIRAYLNSRGETETKKMATDLPEPHEISTDHKMTPHCPSNEKRDYALK